VLANGFRKVVVNNLKELEVLLMHSRKYCAEIAHSVSKRLRTQIVERAGQLGVRVTNAGAGLAKVEQ
jgi:large subunit ribosomal protein L32e